MSPPDPDLAVPLIGLPLAAIGLHGLVRRKPVLVRSRWLRWPMALGCALSFLWAIGRTPDPEFDLGLPMRLLMPGALLVSLVELWVRYPAYLVLGVGPDSVREGARVALDRLSLPFEESESSFRLPSRGAELLLTQRRDKPVVGLRVRPRQEREVLEDFAGALDPILRDLPTRARPAVFALFLVLGVLACGGGAYMWVAD